MITGDAFEEYLFDEVTVKEPKDYLIQVAVRVN